MIAWLIVALVAAEPQTCGKWKGHGIELVETDQTVTVKWERYSEEYLKTITKPFGVLVEAAATHDSSEVHYMTRQKIEGEDVLIFDSLIMVQDCK